MAKFTPRAFGKYFLIEKLAVGGMAEIYKAKTFGVDGFEKLLAIKKILPHCAADKDFIAMLIDEAKLSVHLSHANIVQVYDLGKVGDDYFISMEFIDGFNLRQLMNRAQESEQKIPDVLCVYLTSEVCKGLDYAHHRKDSHNNPLHIVHRDVSPQNILLSLEGEVKIVDFGIAKAAMNMSHTLAGMLKGKVSYMSPEQALGKPVDFKTDIFSIGAVFYELLTGKRLVSGDTHFEVLGKIRSTRVTEASFAAETHIPEALRPILAKALAYRSQDRYDNAGDFQIDLTRYLYTTYRDFSPRQLSGFMKTWFSGELEHRKEKTIQESQLLDAKTQSLLMQAREQENIVHRAGSVLDDMSARSTDPSVAAEKAGVPGATPLPAPTITEHQAARRRHSLQWVIAVLLLVLAGGISAYIYKVYYQGLPAPSETRLYGTLSIASDPAGASVHLNGKNTGLVTPATLNKLDLYIGHRITLEKPRYQNWEKIVTLVNDKPLALDAGLELVPYGSVQIESLPSGASIFLNNEDTGKKTPASFDRLELGKPQLFRVLAPLFRAQEKELLLDNPDPVIWQLELEAELGKISVSSTPTGAQISLDGKDTGKTTPAIFENLALNRSHEIALSKNNYQEKKYNLTLESPDLKAIALILEPIAKPPEAEKEKKEASKDDKKEAKEPRATQSPDASPPPAAAGTASLTLKSTPSDATVYVNGIRVGKTPGTFAIAAGKAEIIVEKEKLFPYRESIALQAGEKKKITTIKLESLTGMVQINSIPSSATVYFDTDKAGNTPIRVRGVQKGKSYTIEVRYPGFKSWSKTMTLKEDFLEIMANLEKN